jgi:hypothetical protein
MTQDILALVVDIGLGTAALHLFHALNKTVKKLGESVDNLAKRVKVLEESK